MPLPDQMEAARGELWKTRAMPATTASLAYNQEFTSDEFARISLGHIPEAMEDKWFIFLDGTTLYLHRSWSGDCIYQVEFREQAGTFTVDRALVNRDQVEYRSTDDAYDAALLHFLISNLLLGKHVLFPVRADVPSQARSLFQHHISGTAYPEDSVQTKPWWKFW
jgi:hypothetical protein